MRLALLSDQIPPEGAGGAEAVVWRLAQGLANDGHDVHVISTARVAAFEESRDDIPTYHIQTKYPERFRSWLSLWNPGSIGALRELLKRLQPDIVNAHNIHFFLSYHALKVARDAGAATVFSAHDVMPFAYSKLRHFVREDSRQIHLPDAYRLPPLYNLRKKPLSLQSLAQPCNPTLSQPLCRSAHGTESGIGGRLRGQQAAVRCSRVQWDQFAGMVTSGSHQGP